MPTAAASTRGTALLAVLVTIPLVGQLYVVLPLLPRLAEEFGGTASGAAVAGTVFGLAYAAGFLLLGPLSDRYGARRVALLSVTAAAVATVAVALAPSFPVFLVLRGVQGFVAAAYFPTLLSYIARRVPVQRRLALTSTAIAASLSASVVGQIVGQLLAPLVGWRGTFVLGAAALVLAAGLVLAVLREPPPEPAAGPDLAAVYRNEITLLSDPRRVALLVATVSLLGTLVLLYTGLQLTGPDALADDDGALLALRAGALPAFVAVPLLTPLLVRVATRTRLLAAMALGAVAAGATALPLGVAGIAVAVFVLAASVAVASPAMVTTITAGASGREGAAAALYTSAIFVGASLGPPLAATLAPRGFGLVALTGAGMLLAGALLVLVAGGRAAAGGVKPGGSGATGSGGHRRQPGQAP